MELGRTVLAVDLDADGVLETVARSRERPGSMAAHVADVSDDDACREAVEAAAALGTLTTIVNSAGVMPPNDTVEQLSVLDWDRTFAVNVRAIFLIARHALAHLRTEGGVIVNVASVHAYASQPGATAYAATKGAIVSITSQLALDLAPDAIRVVAVAPGSVDTPMSQRAAQRSGVSSIAELGFSSSPRAAGRIGSADEVAEVIAWLTTPASSFVNGTTVRADGALLAAIPGATSAPSNAVPSEQVVDA
jgi:NAD(P)-dependent dehydrogenase (short-subunit alcohol dehydrogenase family)